MSKPAFFDVVIIGDGMTGLAAWRRLKEHGVHRIAISSHPAMPSLSERAAGWVAGGQPDNFTRYTHPLGLDRAATFWQFGNRSFAALQAQCAALNLPLDPAPRWRMITSMPELTEARQAVDQMQALGLGGSLLERSFLPPPVLQALGERVLAIQLDHERSAWLDAAALVTALRAPVAATDRLDPVVSIDPAPGAVALKLANGTAATAEVVIVAAHTAIQALIPELSDALVPYADQWSEIQLSEPVPWARRGLGFSANHGNEWAIFTDPDRIRVGGGRYLRPLAGFEAKTATAEPAIAAHLIKQLQHTLGHKSLPKVLATTAGLDIRPCDELPVIGPMFGNSRILVGTGYMGQGLTMGCLAGQCLADLVVTGTAEALPRAFWPERLRSLPTF